MAYPPVTSSYVAPAAFMRAGYRLSRGRGANVDYANPGQPSAHLHLPGEIRNQIMQLILVPGAIHPPAYQSRNCRKPPFDEPIELVKEATKPENVLPGIAFLAVNHQFYIEASTLFYSSNTFYLPTGPVDEATVYFSFLAHSHRAQIRHIAIRFSLADITSLLLTQSNIGAATASSVPPRSKCHGCELAEYLGWIWTTKMAWIIMFHAELIAAGRQGLETVTVEGTFFHDVVLRGKEIPRKLPGSSFDDKKKLWGLCDPKVQDCGKRVMQLSIRVVNYKVFHFGWPKTKEWLENGVDGWMR